jgi:hypothetical protein
MTALVVRNTPNGKDGSFENISVARSRGGRRRIEEGCSTDLGGPNVSISRRGSHRQSPFPDPLCGVYDHDCRVVARSPPPNMIPSASLSSDHLRLLTAFVATPSSIGSSRVRRNGAHTSVQHPRLLSFGEFVGGLGLSRGMREVGKKDDVERDMDRRQ